MTRTADYTADECDLRCKLRPMLPTVFFKFMKDGATSNANVDGSVTPVEYAYAPSAPVNVERMIILIRDTGNFSADGYGNLAVLTNGLDVEFTDGTTTVDLLDGMPVKSNVGWCRYCFDVIDYNLTGGGDIAACYRWTFSKAGAPLRMENGDSLIVRINDNLTGLVEHTFNVQGTTE